MDGDTMTTIYKFKAGFTKLGNATAPASAPLITVVDSANNILVNAQATTALGNMVGAYLYSYSGADDLDLIGKFVTTDLTMDAQDLFSIPQITPASIWSYATRTITSGGITAAEVWDYLLSSVATAGSVGKLIKDYLNAAISTRATPADVAITTSVAISSTVARAISSGSLAMQSYYTMRQTVTSTITDDLTTASKLWLAIKSANVPDASSLIFVEKTAGLTVVNKTVYAATTKGSLVLSGVSGAWNISIFLDETVTGELSGYAGTYANAEIKALIGADTIVVWSGRCKFTAGIVRAVA